MLRFFLNFLDITLGRDFLVRLSKAMPEQGLLYYLLLVRFTHHLLPEAENMTKFGLHHLHTKP